MNIFSNAFKAALAVTAIASCAFSCSAVEKHVLDTVVARDGNSETITAGPLVDHTFNVSSDFSAIKVSGPFDVVFTQTSSTGDFAVTGRIPDNFIKFVDLKVSDGVLIISVNSGHKNLKHRKGEHTKIYITNRTLSKVTINGSGDVDIKGTLNAPSGFSCKISGSGDLDAPSINAQGATIDVGISGAGDAEINSITAKKLAVNISGAGDFECPGINAEDCSIAISGAGDVELAGSSRIVSFTVSGAGDIKAGKLKAATGNAAVSGVGSIKCNVKDLTKSVSGLGKISNASAGKSN